MPLRAVIFDMDGVLTATVEYHFRSWKRLAEQYGIPFTREDNEKLRGLTRRSSLQVILGERKLPEAEIQKMMRLKNEYFHQFIEEMDAGDLLSGVANLLDELHSAGIRVGVASASRNAGVVLEKLGIETYIEALSDGNSVKRSKPAPDVYLQTAEALGESPQDCLAIEDSEAGIQAAIAADMCVIGLGPPERVADAHAVYRSLSGLRLRDLKVDYARWRNRQLAPN